MFPYEEIRYQSNILLEKLVHSTRARARARNRANAN